jgi:hypothetical protein
MKEASKYGASMNGISKLDENVLLIILSLNDNAYTVTTKSRLERNINDSHCHYKRQFDRGYDDAE